MVKNKHPWDVDRQATPAKPVLSPNQQKLLSEVDAAICSRISGVRDLVVSLGENGEDIILRGTVSTYEEKTRILHVIGDYANPDTTIISAVTVRR